MNIHKIDSTSQEHQNFLAQNRKDPITGDSIVEANEVVFCASCKSVFLVDTWKYLDKKHCNQSETLIEFPSTKLDLIIKDEIYFHTFIVPIEGSENIPKLYGSKWKVKNRELSDYHDLFNGAPLAFIVIFGFLVSAIIGFINQNPLPLSGGVILIIIAIISKYFHNSINGKKLETIHRKFTKNTFFISTKGIGFSTNYGIKEHTLNANKIKSLEFNFGKGVFSAVNECIIKYEKGKNTKFFIRNFFKEKTHARFLRALHQLNERHAAPIHITVGKKMDYNIVADFINSNQSRITVSVL